MSKVETNTAARGALGGAADEAGADFRASVAAWAVSFGLASRALPVGDLPQDESSIPVAVRLETDAPVDDIQVDLRSGARVWIQAKSSLSFSKTDANFKSVLEQFVRAIREKALDSHRDRLVLVVSKKTKSLDSLFLALFRAKNQLGGRPARRELKALELLDELTPQLDDGERAELRAVACGLEITHNSMVTAGSVLASGVVAHADAPRAFRELKTIARELAQQRFGLRIEEWAERLARSKIKLLCDPEGSSAARWEARRKAVRRYRADLVRRGTSLDLRPLGAALPPVRHRLAGFSVQATTEIQSQCPNDDVALNVGTRRRGRVVLLGLPGSGKSTALRYLAAEWARDLEAPLPFVVSLRDVAPLLSSEHPFDALARAALRAVRSADRVLLDQDFRERATDGRLALLFDALDETREARFQVVQAIEQLMREISRDVTVVLTTRDSGYAAASTLKLESLRLKAIRASEYTLRQILKAFAAARRLAGAPASAWIEERLAWIRAALDRDRNLAETPLGGVLLALLAAESTQDAWPRGRAKTLNAVVDGVVDRWELSQRQRAHEMGALKGAQAAAALRESFAQIGYLLLNRSSITASELKRELASWLEERWGQSGGAAEVTAGEMFGFWDEAGIFIASEASETVVARLQLLAEIGAARYIVHLPPTAFGIEMEKFAASEELFEVASLAAGLSDRASRMLVSYCVSRGQLSWDLKAAKHLREGFALEESAIQVAQALATHSKIEAGGNRWPAAKAIALMPAPLAMKLRLLSEFNDLLSPDYQCVALAITQAAANLPVDNPAAVLAAVRTTLRPERQGGRRSRLVLVAEDEEIADLIVSIAEYSLPNRRDLDDLLVGAAEQGSLKLWQRLDQSLVRAGRASLVAARNRKHAETFEQMREGLDAVDRDWRRFLVLVGELAPAKPLSFGSSWRLDELADFVATLKICSSDAGAISSAFRYGNEQVRTLTRVAAALGGFDLGVLAAEASIALKLEDRTGFSTSLLCDAGTKREMRHWEQTEVEHSLDSLVELLRGTDWLGEISADALAFCPHPDASDRIEAMLSQIRPINRIHSGVAVMNLGRDVCERAARWQRSTDPLLRQLAAWWNAQKHSGDALNEHCEAALVDTDRGVRVAVIRGLRGKVLSKSIQQRLEHLGSDASDTGFVCLSCGTGNGAEATSCVQCNVVGPEPKREIEKLLQPEPHVGSNDD